MKVCSFLYHRDPWQFQTVSGRSQAKDEAGPMSAIRRAKNHLHRDLDRQYHLPYLPIVPQAQEI